MKLITVSILLICLTAATFSDWCLILAYNLNQNFIGSELCENKEKPAMHCNGHCYLSKQLTKQEKPVSPLNTKNSERFEIQLFLSEFCSCLTTANVTVKKFFNPEQNFTPQQFISSNLHPPQA